MSEIMESEIVYIRSNQSILKSTPNLFTALRSRAHPDNPPARVGQGNY